MISYAGSENCHENITMRKKAKGNCSFDIPAALLVIKESIYLIEVREIQEIVIEIELENPPGDDVNVLRIGMYR